MYRPKKGESLLLRIIESLDYPLLFILIAFFGLFVYFVPRIIELITPPYPDPGPIPPRTLQATDNLSLLWSREEYAIPLVVDRTSLFFATEEQTLVSPIASLSKQAYYLEAFDLVTGQTQWQSRIPYPIFISIYDNNFFVFAGEWLDQAPAQDDQELPYCSFWEKKYSLSTYDVNTGQRIWRYGYRGANISQMFFLDQSVYLVGSHDHDIHQLLINADINSGLIMSQRCNGSAPPPRGSSTGTHSSTYNVISINSDCARYKPFCFAVEANRLHMLIGSSNEAVAYIDFEGAALAPREMDVAVHNNFVVVHLNDSDQLFAFRLP